MAKAIKMMAKVAVGAVVALKVCGLVASVGLAAIGGTLTLPYALAAVACLALAVGSYRVAETVLS